MAKRKTAHPNTAPTGYYNEGQDSSESLPPDRLAKIHTADLDPGLSQHDLAKGDQLAQAQGQEEVVLQKRVGLLSGVSFIVGTMIGSGIFVSPAGVAEGAGSVGLSLVLWAVCGIISMLGALTWAELGTMIPESGGEYSYLLTAFQSVFAFLFSWMSVMLLKPASLGIISLTCAEYIMVPAFMDDCGSAPNTNKVLLATVVILVLTALNAYSVRIATKIQVISTIAKLFAILFIIVGGFVMIGLGSTTNLQNAFEGSQNSAGPIAIAIYSGMWSYDGWNNLNYITEELIEPYKNLPRAILIGLPLVTVCYILVNISYFSVMSVAEMTQSTAVAVTWANYVIPGATWTWVIPLFVALSTFGAANGTLFTGGRLTYVAAREGHMLEILSMVHVKKLTPMPSLVFTCILSIVYIIPGNIGALIDFFNFAVWMFYGLTALACIVLRFTNRGKRMKRPYKVPIPIPFIVVCAAVFLVLAPIIDSPKLAFLWAFLFILAGLIFYFPLVFCGRRAICMTYITMFFQLLMEVGPPKDEPTS